MKEVFVIRLTSLSGRIDDHIKGEGLMIRRWETKKEALIYLEKTFNVKYLYKIESFIEFEK